MRVAHCLIIGLVLASCLASAQAAEPAVTLAVVQTGALWDNVKDKAGATTAEAQDWSAGKLREALAEFASYVPIFREAGFEVAQVSVTLGLIPTVSATFAQVRVLTAEEQAKVLKTHQNKRSLCYMLKSLFKIYGLQLTKYKVYSTDMTLTVPPSTTVTFLVQEDGKPEEAKPEETKAGEAKPDEAKPAEAKAADGKPAEVKPEAGK